MNFKKGRSLESMPEAQGGIQYGKNYVARSRMEQILAQEDHHNEP